jgi:multiple RNA-binding domain-containing protein 1
MPLSTEKTKSHTATQSELVLHTKTDDSAIQVHLPLDIKTGEPKGFAFVQFDDHDQAVQAFEQFDGTVFQGRLLHIIAGSEKRENKLNDFEISKLPLKKQKQIQRKSGAASSTFNWNSLYMNPDAVRSSIAARLGMSKSEVFDPTSSEAAVKQAQAETHIIQETKSFFASNGVDLDAFQSRDRGDTTILVKNFPYGTTSDEIRKLFEETAQVSSSTSSCCFQLPRVSQIQRLDFVPGKRSKEPVQRYCRSHAAC